jgi:hypothetical protein
MSHMGEIELEERGRFTRIFELDGDGVQVEEPAACVVAGTSFTAKRSGSSKLWRGAAAGEPTDAAEADGA